MNESVTPTLSPSFPSLSPTITTLSPTSAPTSQPSNLIDWVLFGLFLFLALISRYLAKLVIALTKGLPIAKAIKIAIRRELEWPLFLGLFALFLFLAFVVVFPVAESWIRVPVYWIVKLICWIIIFIACVHVTRFLIVLLEIIMKNSDMEDYISRGIVEFFGIVRIVALALVALILAVSYVGNDEAVRQTLSIFANINVVSATLVVMFAPIIRSLLAGLMILSDRFIKGDQCIELLGAAPFGRVISVQLRETKIRSFLDGSVFHIPNILFLRHPSINGGSTNGDEGKKKTTVINIKLALSYETSPETLRNILQGSESRNVNIWLDDDLILHARQTDVLLTEVDESKTQLMLRAMRKLQDLGVAFRERE